MEKCDFRPLEGRNRPRDCDFRNLRVKLYRIPKFSSKSVPWGPLSWPFEGIHVYTHVIRNPPRVSHDAICFLNHGFQIRNHLTLHAPTQVSYSTFSPYRGKSTRLGAWTPNNTNAGLIRATQGSNKGNQASAPASKQMGTS